MGRTDNSVVDRPLDEVWERMNDLENWTNLLPSTPASTFSSGRATR